MPCRPCRISIDWARPLRFGRATAPTPVADIWDRTAGVRSLGCTIRTDPDCLQGLAVDRYPVCHRCSCLASHIMGILCYPDSVPLKVSGRIDVGGPRSEGSRFARARTHKSGFVSAARRIVRFAPKANRMVASPRNDAKGHERTSQASTPCT